MQMGLARALVELCTRTRRAGDPHRLAAENNLGDALGHAGQFGEAAEVLTRALAAMKRSRGVDHPDTLNTAQNVASVHHSQGNLAEAEELQVEGLAASRRVNGKEHPDTLAAATNLALTSPRLGHVRLEVVAAPDVLLAAVADARRRVEVDGHARVVVHPVPLEELVGQAADDGAWSRCAEAGAQVGG